MSRKDKISFILGVMFLILAIYFLFIKYYSYSLGWFILSIALFLGVYTPRNTSNREIVVLIDVIMPFVALIIFIYAIIYG